MHSSFHALPLSELFFVIARTIVRVLTVPDAEYIGISFFWCWCYSPAHWQPLMIRTASGDFVELDLPDLPCGCEAATSRRRFIQFLLVFCFGISSSCLALRLSEIFVTARTSVLVPSFPPDVIP